MCSDFSAWFAQVQTLDGTGPGPFPLDMTLVGISDLLTPEFFPTDPSIATKRSGLVEYLNSEYCGQVPDCAPPTATGTGSKEIDDLHRDRAVSRTTMPVPVQVPLALPAFPNILLPARIWHGFLGSLFWHSFWRQTWPSHLSVPFASGTHSPRSGEVPMSEQLVNNAGRQPPPFSA